MIVRENQRKSIEILAPAGSYESFRAAIAAGADAVYAGGPRFGARAFADNFSEPELLAAIDYAHLHGCRFYLTINTLLKDTEIRELSAYLKPLYKGGLDAVIVQDVGVLKLVREQFPQLDIHASTQMTITGAYGAEFLKSMGAVRVVPARELSLGEVQQIKKKTGMEVECFVHGALCYCYSGQCLMSSMIGGRSGNRGQCAQPCRLIYESEGRKGHILSLKDICTLEMIPELVEAGIDSFKIEGRMKRPEYVAGVTAAYRKYTDMYLRYGKERYHVEEQDKEILMDLYNRGGFHSGYYQQRNGKNMITPDRPNHAGVAVFRVLSQSGREVTGLALTQIHAGDVLELSSGKHLAKTVQKNDRRLAGHNDTDKGFGEYTFGRDCEKGKQVKILVPKGQNLVKGTTLYRIKNKKLVGELNAAFVFGKKQEKIYGFLKLSAGKPATLKVDLRGTCVECKSSVNVEKAANRPLDEAQIRKQLCKTNHTEFVFEKLDIETDGSIFLPLQQLNELRRNALEQLETEVCAKYHRLLPDKSDILAISEEHYRGSRKLSVLVETLDQLNVVLKAPGVGRIYLDFDLFESSEQKIRKLCGEFETHTKKGTETLSDGYRQLYVALPFIVRENTAERLEKNYCCLRSDFVDGVLIRNYESFQFLKEHGYDKNIVLDHPLYVMNNQAKVFWNMQGVDACTLPLELNRRELSALCLEHSELIVYGYYPVMFSAQCVKKNVSGCRHDDSYAELTDRYNNHFKVRMRCRDCYNVIYNPDPLYLYDLQEEINGIAPEWIRFQFTNESAAQTARILLACCEGDSYAVPQRIFSDPYTRGHFHRGIS